MKMNEMNFRIIYFNVVFSAILIFSSLFILTFSLKSYIITSKKLNNIVSADVKFDYFLDRDFFLPTYSYEKKQENFSSIKNDFLSLKEGNNNSYSKLDKSLDTKKFDSTKVALNSNMSSSDLLLSLKKSYFATGLNEKKENFIFSILPSVAKENEKILAKRFKLLEIKEFINIHKTLNKSDRKFIEKLSSEYSVKIKNKHKVDIIATLLDSVDVIPNSIVLAQAANESGWGSSRFAKEFNALFGQYTFDVSKGVKPSFREKGEKHLIKFFHSFDDSISSYFKNINTHLAYNDFRQKRKNLRLKNLDLNPYTLTNTLSLYAKDKDYVNTIKSIIRVNRLTQFDNLRIIPTNS